MFAFDLDAAAQNLNKVYYNIVFKYLVVLGLETVQNLAAHRDDRLKFCVSGKFAGTKGAVALNNKDFTNRNVP